MDFPQNLIQKLQDSFISANPGLRLVAVGQEFNKLQLKNIIDMTKQKLIDTLLQLNQEFPDLNNALKMNKEDTEKVQNIITNNIYGSNNPINLATGRNIEQKDFTFNSSVNYSELEKFGVEKEQIEELKLIIEKNKNDSQSLKAKAITWLGTVLSSVATKGLTEHIPAITEFIHQHIIL